MDDIMTMPTYLIDKLRRHGLAVDRLSQERSNGIGEFHDMPVTHALAFDAADFIWAALVSFGVAEAQESRAVRNHVAEAIIDVLQGHGIPDRLDHEAEPEEAHLNARSRSER
ncbi:hypothetical protein ESD82_20865 [Paracoccus pantotrophus]|uniref:Uncharacterized protein n=2 Tax=Paracoccus pantotrophus TaxID=82367 RepID=A0AAE6NXR8_PARPN|nr:hypothetical protein [Paracoccus pantotrophus]QFG38464.1 hypothetical protein ESD82_20865 [Paracoccus pantotrophus]